MKNQLYTIKLRKGDKVVVLSGKFKGKTGKISRVLPSQNKAVVDGINIVKRHLKPTRTNAQGGVIEITQPMWVSKLAVLEPSTKKPSRIGFKIDTNGHKKRIYKTTGKEVVS